MVENIRAAFGRRIDALDWMTPATKARAKEKLAVLEVGIGYPDRWRDYCGLEIVKGDVLGNVERAELLRVPAATSRSSGRPATAASGACSRTTRQRGEPAGAERAQLPGRHPAAAVLRPRRGRRP